MKRETTENNISTKRMIHVIGILVLFVLGTIVMAFRAELLLDELFCLITVNLSFLAVLVLALMKKRRSGQLFSKSTGYGKILLVLGVVWIGEVLFCYLPEYFAPVMLMGVMLTTVLDEAMSLSLGIYFVIIQCVTCGLGTNVLYCYCVLCILGVLLSSFLKNNTRVESLYIYILYFLINVIIPIAFYYIAYLEIQRMTFLYGIVNGLVNCGVILVFYLPLYHWTKEEVTTKYSWLMEEEYSLVKDIRNFSTAEYNHARKVSRLSALCAREIGANAGCAACAGFYYRLGKIEGEPEIDNALKVANNHCFPVDVMNILEEYGGIVRLPQTPESAIVHMVDALVTKIEILDKDTMSSTWNQDMVIYQTLNELSQNGWYDESKMSMNQFLKIREKLVQEDALV